MNRGRLKIVGDILKISENWVVKARVQRRVNLDSKQAKYYLSLLVGKGFLNRENNGEGIRYRTSGKGGELLKYMENIDNLFNG